MAMTLRLDDDEQAALKAMAEREGLSQHDVARRAILERSERTRRFDAVQASGLDVIYLDVERWGSGHLLRR